MLGLAATALMLLAANVSMAQDEVAADGASPPAKLTLVAANGDRLDYRVSDASLYLSSNPGYEGVAPTTDLSLSLSAITPLNAELLEWAAQTGAKTKDDYDIVLTGTLDEDGTPREVQYEISGALVNSFSTSLSVYATPSVSLSLTGGKLVMDGIAMN
ncbi:MAG: hypothetical protein P0Y65_05400 [Candidatus Devosia phytovorans]|uniref:Uncharacterized protein n=1 Tax=Candidatus Devosia phytovorans TaxID=3121372 RepID=A0AAJ6B1E1_9HYPH|nr:hypothetical protein [Devosia sp.]WEK05691.1 MAG: hypothetical protein P0Y65_05400 [Devosia sp.]